VIFGMLLTRAEVAFAGRAYAEYGGVYIMASLLWLWAVEGMAPDRWDTVGRTGMCLVGAAVIL
jgi:small multidrug resistance family-3 protein